MIFYLVHILNRTLVRKCRKPLILLKILDVEVYKMQNFNLNRNLNAKQYLLQLQILDTKINFQTQERWYGYGPRYNLTRSCSESTATRS